MFRRSRGAARDVVVLQDPVESMSPDQIALVVDPIPVVPSALVQARVDEGERLPALVHLVEHKLPVPKDVGRRRGPAALSGLAVVVGALGVRLWKSSFGGAAGGVGYRTGGCDADGDSESVTYLSLGGAAGSVGFRPFSCDDAAGEYAVSTL